MFSNFFQKYLKFVTTHPKLILALIALLAIVMLAGLPRFKLDASPDSLTLEHDEDIATFREVAKRYQSGDFLVVTYKPNKDLFSDQPLKTLKSLQDDLSEVEGIESIDSILTVPLLYSPLRSLTETVSDVRTLETPNVDLNAARKEFLTSPIYRNLILGPDEQTTALLLHIAVDDRYIDLVQRRDELKAKKAKEGLSPELEEELHTVSETFLQYRTKAEARGHQRVADVRSIVADYKDDAQIFVGGISMITADMISFIRSDLKIFGVAVLLFMIATLAIIFRSVRFVVIPMATCTTAVLLMLGLVSWLDWRLTVISSNFVALLLIISLAIIIHLVVRYREYLEENPDWSQQELVLATVNFMIRPCLYTSLTTIVAFVSLVVSDIRPVIDFGWMMTIGLVVAFILAFTLLPASLMLLKPQNKPGSPRTKDESKPALTLKFSSAVEKHGKSIWFGALVVAVLSAWGISRLQVENKFIDYFHHTTEIYQGLSVIDKNLGGTTSLDIVLTADEEDLALLQEDNFVAEGDEADPFATEDPFAADDFDDPFAGDEESEDTQALNYWMTVAGLKKVDEIHTWLEAQPEIGVVQSLAVLYRVGKDINGSLNAFELALMEKSLPQDVKNVLYEPYIAPEENQARIALRVHDLYPGLKRKELENRIRTHVQESGVVKPENVQLSGILVLYNNMLQSLFSSQILTLGAVFLGIMLMFIILFRSLLVATIAILPNMLAAFSILGFMGLIGLPLDMMTITIAAITVGIGVDNAIHYVYRFKKEVAEAGDYVVAMHRSHASIGRAMFYTSVIIVFGFSIMGLSKFIPTIYFGALTGLAMLAALMGSLLLLPKLILWVRPFSLEKSASE